MKLSVKNIITAALVGFLLMACAKQPGSTRYKGKIKRGKPIPCPVKDC